jgi:guanyl-specific ribonuclease Sa
MADKQATEPTMAEVLAALAETRAALAASEARATAAESAKRETGARQWAGNVPVPEAMADTDRWIARVYPEIYAALGIETGNREVIRLITVASKAYGYVQADRRTYGGGNVPGPVPADAEATEA